MLNEEPEESFKVVVRVRPLNENEKRKGLIDIVQVIEGKLIVVSEPAASDDDYLRHNRAREKKFAFDRVFDARNSQEEVFNEAASRVVQYVLGGFNATVFAYGPTGSGKTFTMLGTVEQPGVMVRALERLFEEVEANQDVLTKVTISYLEVYNENIRDLLSPTSDHLELREDPLKGAISVNGIKECEVNNAEEVMSLLQYGNKNRTTEPTQANATSSRSHAVCQVHVERRAKTSGLRAEIITAKLSLIDLAGSERASETKNRGIRLVEGANINRSLLALGNCINALGDKKKKGAYVPYRDSKLTRLLKDSLGGKAKTVMIVNVSSSSGSFEEIINTLKYANRAKNIKIEATQNVKNVSYHIKEYQNIINDLRNEIFELKQKLATQMETEEKSFEPTDPLESFRERQQLAAIQQQFISNFNERLQLRRSLIELKDTNATNLIEIERMQADIQRLSKDIPGSEDMNRDKIYTITSEIAIITENIKANKETAVNLEKAIKALEQEAVALINDFPNKITKLERRNFLSLLIQSQNLELQNMELEVQLGIRDKIISDQRRILKENGLDGRINVYTESYDREIEEKAETITKISPQSSRSKENGIFSVDVPSISPLSSSRQESGINLRNIRNSSKLPKFFEKKRKKKNVALAL